MISNSRTLPASAAVPDDGIASSSPDVFSESTPSSGNRSAEREQASVGLLLVNRPAETTICVPVETVIPVDLPPEIDADVYQKIKALWVSEEQVISRYRLTKDELKRNRQLLSEELYHLREKLVGTGRDGKWEPFLERIGMPRTTADRCVRQWRDRLNPKKFTSGALMTQRQLINQFIKELEDHSALWPRTDSEVTRFVAGFETTLRDRAKQRRRRRCIEGQSTGPEQNDPDTCNLIVEQSSGR